MQPSKSTEKQSTPCEHLLYLNDMHSRFWRFRHIRMSRRITIPYDLQ